MSRFLDDLEADEEWVYAYAFLPLMAADADTPEETLTMIARTRMNLSVAYALVANCEGRRDNVPAGRVER